MVEPRPITVFLARFRVGCDFKGMIEIARCCPHCGTNEHYSTRSLAMSRVGPFWDSSCFCQSSSPYRFRQRKAFRAACLQYNSSHFDEHAKLRCPVTPEAECPRRCGNVCKTWPP